MRVSPGFAVTVALRFLREGRMQTLLIVVGVAAGVAVVSYISALIQGLQGNTIRRTLGTQAHLVVQPPEQRSLPSLPLADGAIALRELQARAQRPRTIDNWRAVEQALAAAPGVRAVTALASGSMLAVRGEASRSVTLAGIDLDSYERIVSLRATLVQGVARVAPGEALVGTTLASDLGIALGDRFVVRSGGEAAETFRIAGLLDLGNRELNRRSVFVGRGAAQSLLAIPGGVTQVWATVDDPFAAQGIAERASRRLGLQVESWMETNAQLLSALNAQGVSTSLIRSFTALVVMLGIASVLVVSVVHKRKEIGILRAMGATRAQMTQVFLVQGALVGLVGSLLGVALAALLLWGFSTFVRGSDGLPLFVVTLGWDLALKVPLVATFAGIVAAVAPARSAARLDPAQAIRL
ncbi:MAG TPA: FtsX-like permease family protein [Rubrivivax sp.]|nr:FtsX-like permease family protein [Rubrivivax sp.]